MAGFATWVLDVGVDLADVRLLRHQTGVAAHRYLLDDLRTDRSAFYRPPVSSAQGEAEELCADVPGSVFWRLERP